MDEDAGDDKKLRRAGGRQGFLHEESWCQQLRGFFGPCKAEPPMINKVKPSINKELSKASSIISYSMKVAWAFVGHSTLFLSAR